MPRNVAELVVLFDLTKTGELSFRDPQPQALGLAVVTRRPCGGGMGAALVGAVRRRAQADCEAIALDHATPLSATFWPRRGFQSVWTRWAREAKQSHCSATTVKPL